MNLLKIAISAVLATGVVAGAVSAQNFKATSRAGVQAKSTTAAASYKPQTARGQAASAIVRTWAGYVQSVYGTAPASWARAMQATFAQADVGNMQRAATRTTFEGMMSALMGQRTTDAQIIDKLAMSDGSLAVVQALGSPSVDLVYTAVVPCRVFDTRVAVGAMTAGETRHFVSAGADFVAQGGAASDCGIPEGASAVVMNVTAVGPASGGYLTVFPYGATQPLAASVNFIVRADNGNELVVKQTMGQAYDFSVFAFSQSHVVGDVAGYYMAPIAGEMDCLTANGTQSQIAPGAAFGLTATCQAGYSVTGGGVRSPGGNTDLTTSESYAQNGTSWFVNGRNTSSKSDTLQARAHCCRNLGR